MFFFLGPYELFSAEVDLLKSFYSTEKTVKRKGIDLKKIEEDLLPTKGFLTHDQKILKELEKRSEY